MRVRMHALAHWLLATFALTASLCSARAQTIEGQPIASQFGEYRVTDVGNEFAFTPDQCNVSGGGMNFPAFTTGVPVKVWDPQPGFTEVSTSVTAFVSASDCAVSLGGLVHPHLASFYLTSGTGGLQEALTNSKVPAGGNNTIILNTRWYELIAPRSAAAVISSVVGSTAFGLVDITTNPYTSYNWNGSQYVVVSTSGGAPTGAASGSLSGTYPSPGLAQFTGSQASALFAQMTGCTIPGYVFSPQSGTCVAAGGAPSGSAGGSLTGTYPSPGLSSAAVVAGVAGQSIAPTGANNVLYAFGYPYGGCVTTSGGTTTTQGDCAFYSAVDLANTMQNSVDLIIGDGYLSACAEWVEPSAFWTVNLIGTSVRGSFINKICSTPTLPVISKGSGGQAGDLVMRDFTVVANANASSCGDIWNLEGYYFDNLNCSNPLNNTDHEWQFGQGFAYSGVAEDGYLGNVSASSLFGYPGTEAAIATTYTSGALTSISCSACGNYDPNGAPYIKVFFVDPHHYCDTLPTASAVQTGATITSLTEVTAGSCPRGNPDVQAYDSMSINYGIVLNISDSETHNLQSYVGTIAGVYMNGGADKLFGTHVVGMATGIKDAGNSTYHGTELDSIAARGFDFESPGTQVYGTIAYQHDHNFPGYSMYYYGASGTDIVVDGVQDWNANAGSAPADYQEFTNASGVLSPSAGNIPGSVHNNPLSQQGGDYAQALTTSTRSTGDKSAAVATTQFVYNNQPSLMAQYFGAYGDAYSPQDGCQTTASSNVITCPDAPFVAGDVGKQVWVTGAGASGTAFNATINTVTSNTAVVTSANATATISNTPGNTVYGHDDTAAVQACWQYSATNAVQCTLRANPGPGFGTTGFLIGTASLQLVSDNADLQANSVTTSGSGGAQGTNFFCEFNGDCISLAAGPIQGAVVSNLTLLGNPSQPNGRGIHLNAQAGTYGNGGLFNSTFANLQVNNFALECMWLDGGGGAGYSYNLPNQIDSFIQFQCNGPNQAHPANMIKMTGQAAQILVQNGQINGASYANYPNPLIYIGEKTSGLSDSPVDVKFYGYTYEVGQQGLYVGEGASNIHFDSGYIENVYSPLIAYNAPGLTFNGNHIANSGNVTAIAQFNGGVTGGMRDNYEYGSGVTVAALATCTGSGNTIDFAGNQSSVMTTTGCATSAASPSTATLTVTGGSSVSVAANSTAMRTITASGINPGKTLTLYASGTFMLASGGNINLGGFASPLTVSAGNSVTLTLLDQTAAWLVTATTPAGGATTNLAGGALGSAPYQTAASTTGFINSPTTSGHAFAYLWQPAGSAIAPAAVDLASFPPIDGLTFTANATGFKIAGGTTSKTAQWNNTLTFAGTDSTTMTFPGASTTVAGLGTAETFTAAQAINVAGAASLAGLAITGAPYTAGSATTDFPQTYLNCTGATAVTSLSTAGTMFGINSCNGFTGHLINLFANGGSTRFRVDYQGNTFVAGTATVASNLGLSSTTAPTIANGAAAGTSPGTPTVTGNNNAGVITVITGTATTASATLATITFNGTLGTIPNGCGLTPRNAAATGANLFYTTAPTSTAFTIALGSTAAAASTTYSWSYLCL